MWRGDADEALWGVNEDEEKRKRKRKEEKEEEEREEEEEEALLFSALSKHLSVTQKE